MDTINKADEKATAAHFAWYGYDRIPLYPQPGIFETTIAAIDGWPDGKTRIITSGMIEDLLSAPAFDWRDVLARIDSDREARARVTGWGQPNDGAYHYFTPDEPEAGWPGSRPVRSACGSIKLLMAVSTMRIVAEPDADAPGVPCKTCLSRMR